MHKYTIEQVKNAFGVLMISSRGRVWLEVNVGDGFDEYFVEMDLKYCPEAIVPCCETTYHHIWEIEDELGFEITTKVLYDQENFIRHFGTYFLKF